MNKTEIDALMRGIVPVFRDYVDARVVAVVGENAVLKDEVAVLSSRLQEVEERGVVHGVNGAHVSGLRQDGNVVIFTLSDGAELPAVNLPPGSDGKDVDAEEVRAMIAEEVSKLPPAEPGQDGKDADPEVVREMIAEEVSKLQADVEEASKLQVDVLRETVAEEVSKLPQPGVDSEQVRSMVAEEVSKLPPAEPGKDADPEAVREMIAEEVSKLPQPEVDLEQVREMIAEEISKLPPPEPGKDGRSVSPEEVRAIVDEVVAALPPPKDGEDGKSVDVEEVRAMVQETIAQIPIPKDGESVDMDAVAAMIEDAVVSTVAGMDLKGEPGESVDLDSVVSAVVERCAAVVSDQVERAVAAIPVPEDGRGIADLVIDREGCLVLTFTDGGTKNAGVVVGRDGHDGMSVEDMSFDYDAENRTLNLRFSRGDVTRTFGVKVPVPIYRGVYSEGSEYEQADTVTWSGSTWLARKDAPEGKPGESGDWQLCVKRGREGKPGKNGKDATVLKTVKGG